MKANQCIGCKAAFLLAVFTYNTVAGFACAMGMDMGFNSKHHENDNPIEAIVRMHADAKRHIHQEKEEWYEHDHRKSKRLDNVAKESASKEDNCCSDEVARFQQPDKRVGKSVSVIHPVIFASFPALHDNVSLIRHPNTVNDIKPFVRSYHPLISDIRIAIQSFQI